MSTAPDAERLREEDAELMRRLQGADDTALADLMQRWERPVKALIARMVLNTAEAEELAQETFVRIWQHRGRFDTTKPFKPWILGIAANLARNRLRWWRRRPSIQLDEWMKIEPPVATDQPEGTNRLEQQERAAAVRDAIARLPVDLREALILFQYERMSYIEIASAVGATPKAVENRLARARAKLRPALRAWA